MLISYSDVDLSSKATFWTFLKIGYIRTQTVQFIPKTTQFCRKYNSRYITENITVNRFEVDMQQEIQNQPGLKSSC